MIGTDGSMLVYGQVIGYHENAYKVKDPRTTHFLWLPSESSVPLKHFLSNYANIRENVKSLDDPKKHPQILHELVLCYLYYDIGEPFVGIIRNDGDLYIEYTEFEDKNIVLLRQQIIGCKVFLMKDVVKHCLKPYMLDRTDKRWMVGGGF